MSAYLDQPRTFDTLMALMPGALVFTYLAGTLTPAPTYAVLELRRDPADIDALLFDLSSPHPNPLVSDAAGRLPPIFLDPAVSYRFIVQTSAGVEVHDLDPFTTFPGPALITPLTDSGEPMPLATLAAYQSQTTVLVAQITADIDGEFAPLDLADEQAYRIMLRDAAGKLIYDVDPYLGVNGAGAPGGGGVAAGGGSFGPAVALSFHQCLSTGIGVDVISGYRLGADGVLYEIINTDGTINVFTPVTDEWLLTFGNFEVRATVTFGLAPFGTGASAVDVWLPLSADVNYWIRVDRIAEPDQFETHLFVEIREIGELAILASADFEFGVPPP